MTAEKYDAIVIGAGQAGGPLSTTLACAGWKTALIERKYVGGTCVNEGCTPTKTMAASARVAHLARRAADYGVQTGPITVDLTKVRQRKRDIVNSFRKGSQGRIEKTEGLDLLLGQARFTGSKTLEVALNDGQTRQITAKTLFINVGTRPTKPAIPGLDGVPVLDSTSIMELAELPAHLLVIGGGYVGLEFAQMFRRFGSQVTIVQRGQHLLSREDTDVAEAVAEILGQDGIEVLLQTEASGVEQADNGRIHLTADSPDGQKTVTGSHLLLAAGRIPNADSLNLASTGVETGERGFIRVNERLETNVSGIYALGDVTGGAAFTHIAYDDYRIIRANLLEDGDSTTNDRLVPYTVFIDPQLGRVGLTEQEAKKQGLNYLVAKQPMRHVARALEVDETRGFMKAIVDAGTDQILGCAILGIEGGEVMSVLQMAMLGQTPYTVIRDGVFAHPTLAESLNNLFMTLDTRPGCEKMAGPDQETGRQSQRG